MSGYILCQTRKASVPYYIENISTNIYSLEELCYYLYHNLYLVDGTIMNEGLCQWLQKELELPELAEKLRIKTGKFSSIQDVLYPVFKEINYLSYDELKGLNLQIRRYDEETPLVREKRKADSLAENCMYVNAIRVYDSLLGRKDLEEECPGMTASLHHNEGCAYSYLFQMEKALDCFMKAYECRKDEESLKCYLLAFRCVRTPIEYESCLEELGVDANLRKEVEEQLAGFAKKPEIPVYSQHIDGLLEKFTQEYHRSTGS